MTPRQKRVSGLTQREENFVLRYSVHGNASRAYRETYGTNAGPGSVNNQSSAILKNPKVQERLRALHEASKSASLVDHHRLCLMYLEAFELAKQRGNDLGMTAATTQLAKLGGFMIDRSVSVQKKVGEMSDADLRRELDRVDDELRQLSSAGVKAAALPHLTDPAGSRSAPEKSKGLH